MVGLRRILAPRRRRKPRADAPRTIVPVTAEAPAGSPAARIDAARERLRRQIPAPADDD